MDRRTMLALSAAGLVAAGRTQAQGTVGDDGLYDEHFLKDSFLEMALDHEEAADQGKSLAILFEQRGCPYCRELHEVNFKREEITSYLSEHFDVVQLGMFGSRAVLDFDGEELEERDLAVKWFVNFTPTMLFFPPETLGATSLREAEVFRLPGYFKPFHFISGLEYVVTQDYKNQHFQRYLQDKFAKLAEQGIDPEVW